MEWIKTKDRLPDVGEELEVSDDGGKTFESGVEYMMERTCMMAGIAGGNGYFGEGFGMSGSNGCDRGLTADEPIFWRYAAIK